MKLFIYLSGIAGTLLVLFSIVGTLSAYAHAQMLFFVGIGMLLLVFVPLVLVGKYRENKRIDQIIHSYRDKKDEQQPMGKGKAATKGWSMNNSPFRERKSGLSWGGGNIKASNAQRGSRKSFLK